MRFILRFIGVGFTAGAIVFLGLAAVGGFVIWKYTQDLPDYTVLRNYEPKVMTRVHASDGSLMAEYAVERRLYLPIQAVPKLVISAYLSAEDKNFYSHNGFDPAGTVRALVANASGRGRGQQGASTITQQVAKNFLVGDEKSYTRKIKELFTSFRIEATYSKDKILELYLNEIYLGLGNYGIAAASLNYFGKSVHELQLHEAAYLAALPKAPNNYHPFDRTRDALSRRNWVLDRMVENGVVARNEAEDAKKLPLGVNIRTVSPHSLVAGFFAEDVRREIVERYGSRRLYTGGLSVRTTLVPSMQVQARKALVDGLVRFDEARGWRGAIQKLELAGREWGAALSEVRSFRDVEPWRLAVVLNVSDATGAQIGLQPRREVSGSVSSLRETGTLTPDGVRWTRKGRLGAVVSPGDVVYVEPIDGKIGQFRLRQVPEISGAIVALDPHTGRILAMVGGFSSDQSEFNRATQANRQPGSAFKPLVYATALDNGYTPSSIILDTPIEIDQGPGQAPWRPENYDGKPTGPRTLRYGIEHSKNLMTVRLARDVGMPLIAEYVRRFGVADDLLPVLAMSLGAGETTPLKLTAAYAMFANGGRRIKPSVIDRVQDRWGNTIYRHDERQCEGCAAQAWANQNEPRLVDRREQVIDPMTAYQITSIMEGVIQRGTAQVIKETGRRYLAGKTGTTNEAKDVWFVGYSADLAVGVFLGYDTPRSLGNSATAGQYAAPIFRDFVKAALAGKPDTPFRAPTGIKLIAVNPSSGLRAASGDRGAILEPFKPGTAPPESIAAFGGGGSGRGAAGNPDADRAIGAGTGGLY